MPVAETGKTRLFCIVGCGSRIQPRLREILAPGILPVEFMWLPRGSAVDSFRSLLRNTLDARQTSVTPLIYGILG